MTVVKNSLYLALGSIAEKAISFIIIIILARYLGKEDFGLFTFLFAYTNLFIFIYDFGIQILIAREIAKTDSISFLYNALFVQVLSSLSGALLTYSSLSFLGYSESIINMGFLVILTLIFNIFSMSLKSVFIAFEEMIYSSVIMVIIKASVLIGVIFVTLTRGDLFYMLIIYPVTAGLNLTLNLYFVKKRYIRDNNIRLSLPTIKYIVRESFPLSMQMVFIQIYFHIVSVMLSNMQGDGAVGLYNAAYRIIFVLLFFSDSIAMAVFPRIARNGKGDDSPDSVLLYKTAMKVLGILGVLITIIIFSFSDIIIDIVFGSNYTESKPILRLIIWVLPFMFVTNFMGRVLSAIGCQRDMAKITGIGSVINIGLNIFLIPIFSCFGAAAATILTEIWIFLMQFKSISKSFTRIPLSMFRLPAAASLCVLLVYLIIPVHKPLFIFIVVITLGYMLITASYFSGEEISRFKDMLKSIYSRAKI